MGGNDDKTEVIRKHGKTRFMLEWGGKSLLAIIPALATGYFSMRESRISADIEIARINAKAGAGYEAMVDAIKEESSQRKMLTEEARRLAAYTERLELRLDVLSRSSSAEDSGQEGRTSRGGGSSRRPEARPAGSERPATVTVKSAKFFPEQKQAKAPPKSLEDVAKMKGL